MMQISDNISLTDWQNAQMPDALTLQGQYVKLMRLDASKHLDDLYTAATAKNADVHQWDYLAVGPFAGPADFSKWLQACAQSNDPLFFSIIDPVTNTAQGIISYLAIVPEHGSIEIGHVWFSASMQQTNRATEAIYLLARYAFTTLGYRRLEWKCDSRNIRSQKAAQRFGFTYEGLFRQHRIVKGQNRDTAWFSMLDKEWPTQALVFEKWLNIDNFDADYKQKQSLDQIRLNVPKDLH